MGWADCGYETYKGKRRHIGYAFSAMCDHPGCRRRIDRGLAYACGQMHGELGGRACNGYFCGNHLTGLVPAEEEDPLADVDSLKVNTISVCAECNARHRAYVRENKPKPTRRKRAQRPKK